MPYDPDLADRLRQHLDGREGIAEIRMMGGLVFTLQGHMCCGVTGAALMVRVGPDAREAALARPYVRPLEIGAGRAPRAFVCVDPGGIATDQALADWVDQGVAFVRSLPAKT